MQVESEKVYKLAMQMNIFSGSKSKGKVKKCDCGSIKGKSTVLNSFAHIGITTEFLDNVVFKNNAACYVENNYCPQCGEKYE